MPRAKRPSITFGRTGDPDAGFRGFTLDERVQLVIALSVRARSLWDLVQDLVAQGVHPEDPGRMNVHLQLCVCRELLERLGVTWTG